jgi:pyruvate dehydrogenase E2 component (dihydrolipoamide acetyltransferase)
MPDIGTTVEQVKLVRWLKAVGDAVKRGEMLCEVETDKATSELESIAEGVLLTQVVPAGEDVQQGAVIAYVGAPGEVPPVAAGATGGSPARAASATNPQSPIPNPSRARTGGQAASGAQARETSAPTALRVSPMVRRLAEREGVDLADVAGTGPGGLVTREDVLRAKASRAAPAGSAAAVDRGDPGVPLPREQLAVARRVARSNREIPTIDLTASIDMSGIVESRRRLAQQSARKISFDAFFVRAAAAAIKKFPTFAGHAGDDRVFPHEAIDVCLAVSHDRKLFLPPIRGADRLTLEAIQAEIERIVGRIRGGHVGLAELSGGCMTVSNLGMYPIDSFLMIIPPEQSAALAIGATQERPVARLGQVVVRPLASVALSVDHRMINGAEAAEFLSSVKDILETP